MFLSQAARALGLRGDFDAGHALLDTLDRSTPEVSVRRDLERGRLLRHYKVLRTLANRWVGILHGYLKHQKLYNEEPAWAHRRPITSIAA